MHIHLLKRLPTENSHIQVNRFVTIDIRHLKYFIQCSCMKIESPEDQFQQHAAVETKTKA